MFDKNLYYDCLDTRYLGRHLYYFREIDSTNTFAIKNELEVGSIVISDVQVKGKGRSNRVWRSQSNQNLYFSCLVDGFTPEKLLQLNIVIGYSVCNVLRKYISCCLKWPNDIIAEKRKLGGILIETKFSGNKIEKVVFGVGLNVNTDNFEKDISDIAVSIKNILGRDMCREALLAELVNELEKGIDSLKIGDYNIDRLWGNYSCFLGRDISVTLDNVKKIFIEKGIDRLGGLIVEDNSGMIKTLYSGDVGYDFCS